MRMVLSWGQLIYIFFPIPIFCLALLSLAWPRKLERAGSRIVSKIFFTEIRAGPVHVKLLYFFLAMSVLIFVGSVRSLNRGAAPCKTCVYAGETLWYEKAMKFRLERNFWLSLFNAILWVMVWTVQRDRTKILSLKDRVAELEDTVASSAVSRVDETEEVPTEEVPTEEVTTEVRTEEVTEEKVEKKSEEAKKKD